MPCEPTSDRLFQRQCTPSWRPQKCDIRVTPLLPQFCIYLHFGPYQVCSQQSPFSLDRQFNYKTT